MLFCGLRNCHRRGKSWHAKQGTKMYFSLTNKYSLMAYEQKAGSGSLFRNDKKGNEKAPDYKGSGKDLNGNEVWLSGWVRKSEKGTQYLSISMQPKEPKPAEVFNPEGYKEPIEETNNLPF